MVAHHFVTFFVFVFPLSLIVCYLLAHFSKHMDTAIPVLSRISAKAPESCIFTATVNLSAVLYLFIAYIRYLQISKAITDAQLQEMRTSTLRTRNSASFVFGSGAATSLSFLASFRQEYASIMYAFGLSLWYFFTPIFLCLQTSFCFALETPYTKGFIKFCRVVLVVLVLLSFLISSIFYSIDICLYLWKKGNFPDTPEMKISTTTLRIGVTSCYWAVILFQQLFFATFWPDFKKISLSADKIECLN